MLRSEFLAKNLIYVSTKHNNNNLKKYLKCLKIAFKKFLIWKKKTKTILIMKIIYIHIKYS